MIKANEVRNMTVDEIRVKVEAMRKDLYGLRVESKAGRVEKPHKMRELRRDIARCLTIIQEKANATSPAK